MDQRESSILTWQMCLLGQLLHLTACPLPAAVCLLSPEPPVPLLLPLELWSVPAERGPGHLHQVCRLPLHKCSALTMEPWFSRGPGTHSAISLQHPNIFRSAWPWAVPVDMKHVCVLIYSCHLFCRSFKHLLAGGCVSTMTCPTVRHISSMWGPTEGTNPSPSSWWGLLCLPGVLPANVAQPQLQSSPRDPHRAPVLGMEGSRTLLPVFSNERARFQDRRDFREGMWPWIIICESQAQHFPHPSGSVDSRDRSSKHWLL